jgi:hypothetical protein
MHAKLFIAIVITNAEKKHFNGGEMMKQKLIPALSNSNYREGTPPKSTREKETIPMVQYDILSNNPYKYTKETFYEEVYWNRLGRKHLKISSYSLYRNELRKKWGWGIHIDENGKIALVGIETDKYQRLKRELDCDND